MTAKRVKKRGHVRAIGEAGPRVGIVYLVGDKLWIDAAPVARGLNVGDYVIHQRDHQEFWKQLVNQGAVPSTKHDEFPRGRVSYHKKRGEFTLLADHCILVKRSVVSKILSRMRLPVRATKTGMDYSYRCLGCMRPGL
jgi:hypothetical protein